MRPIKFRGISVDTGEWVYGSLDLYCDGYCSIGVQGKNPLGESYLISNHIDPKTISQFTGFVDRNGTDIYDGDILRVYHFTDKNDVIHYMYKSVFWHSEYGVWFLRHDNGEECNYLYTILRSSVCEVIGNLTENPELLEATK